MAVEKSWVCPGKDCKKEFENVQKCPCRNMDGVHVLPEPNTVYQGAALCKLALLWGISWLEVIFWVWIEVPVPLLQVGWSGGTCVLVELQLSPWPLQFPPAQEHYWSDREHSLAPITIIRSEYLTRSCIGQLTPRQGHNKSGLFLLSSLFIPVSGFLLAPGARAKSSQNNSPYTLSKELLKSIQ